MTAGIPPPGGGNNEAPPLSSDTGMTPVGGPFAPPAKAGTPEMSSKPKRDAPAF